MRLRLGPLALTGSCFLAACTPLGAWLYDDPSFALQGATFRPAPAPGGRDSLELVFSGCNLNDFDLVGEGFEARLVLADRQVGTGRREHPYYLHTRDTSRVIVTLALDDDWLEAAGASGVRFELLAELLLLSPAGERRVGFRKQGTLIGGAQGLAIHGLGQRPCRPGLSQLPSVFVPRVTIRRGGEGSQ
ncbi:MAG TPA: hypothetical protein VNJ71_14580 [Gemmatimonadales bacterium]|nr:hypothetical protein [Gemmatimonadales bacterium]